MQPAELACWAAMAVSACHQNQPLECRRSKSSKRSPTRGSLSGTKRSSSVSQIALNWVLQRPTVSTLVIGARNRHINGLAKVAFNFKNYTVERFAEMVGWDLTVIEGVLEDECVALYRDSLVELTR